MSIPRYEMYLGPRVTRLNPTGLKVVPDTGLMPERIQSAPDQSPENFTGFASWRESILSWISPAFGPALFESTRPRSGFREFSDSARKLQSAQCLCLFESVQPGDHCTQPIHKYSHTHARTNTVRRLRDGVQRRYEGAEEQEETNLSNQTELTN